ncbi:MAG: YmdB family metallophosphoesterase [Oscillospiraceae bacterium]|jgi:metallophosphoesterase (TIGR00282 family)|nr:YmdB family metallophosphoesterase [Oscillospiraceae bacterium]
MKILMLGDVVGDIGCDFLNCRLPGIKRLHQLDLVVANGENSAASNGVSFPSVRKLRNAGVDVITTGNHAFYNRQSSELFGKYNFLLRPANSPPNSPGCGVFVCDKGGVQVCVINLIGRVFMPWASRSAFETIDGILKKRQKYKFTVVDFHAEATSEKKAMAFHLDGRVSAVVGTHTHVPTADQQILPKGTAYVTDLGMVGPKLSVLGMDPVVAAGKFNGRGCPEYKLATGECELCGVFLTLDEGTGKAIEIESLRVTE